MPARTPAWLRYGLSPPVFGLHFHQFSEPAISRPMARPFGIFLIALFFAVATGILLGAGGALLLPGSKFETIWTLYPARRALLMPYRLWLGPGFLVLAVATAAASAGCFRRRLWGWWIAVAIFALNGLGDVAQLALGHFLEGGVGIAASGATIFYLSRLRLRGVFERGV